MYGRIRKNSGRNNIYLKISNFSPQHNNSTNHLNKNNQSKQKPVPRQPQISIKDNPHLNQSNKNIQITLKLNIYIKIQELEEEIPFNLYRDTMKDKNLSRLMIKRWNKSRKVFINPRKITHNMTRLSNGMELSNPLFLLFNNNPYHIFSRITPFHTFNILHPKCTPKHKSLI